MINEKAFEIYEYEPYRDGYKILGLSDDADLDQRYSLYFPEGTVAIGEGAFSCESVLTVSFPRSLVIIEDSAFSDCEYLFEVVFQDGTPLNSIGEGAFERTSIATVTLPESIVEIGNDAFAECKNLNSVNFTALYSLKKIGDGAFSGCVSLKSASLPDGIQELGFEAFSNCSALNFVGIPSSVREVGFDAFSGCYSLNQLNISLDALPKGWDEDFLGDCRATLNLFGESYTPMSKLKIAPHPYSEGKYILNGTADWNLEELNLHPDIIEVAPSAFKEHLKLRSFKANCPYIVVRGGAFESCNNLEKIDIIDGYFCNNAFIWSGITQAILPSGFDFGVYQHSSVESFTLTESCNKNTVFPYTFSHTRITELKIPTQFTRIGHHAFSDCALLEKLDLNKVEDISESAFEACGSLKEIIFPKNKLNIWPRAFKDCLDLEKVEIYQGTSLSNESFAYCRKLSEVIIHGEQSSLYTDSFAFTGLRKLILKDSYSMVLEKFVEEMLPFIIATPGDTLTVVYKDKTVVKTKRSKAYWI